MIERDQTDQERLIARYSQEIEAAFVHQMQALLEYLDKGIGKPASIAGRCGAELGAAHKRCKRSLVLMALRAERDRGLDVTPAVAAHCFQRLIGRSIDDRAAAATFATPGRTAADKSRVSADDLAALESTLRAQVRDLIIEMEIIRVDARETYAERTRAAAREQAEAKLLGP
ncbi:hypothetical protein LZ023_40685 (plasmid) [Pseudomonas silvicola]|nr:hypothetical protein LZ023_40960 [Pseudomonas silvicola]WAH62252.1 hypothetical protein LZ023_40685 [Pseudomonas silvicola]